MTTNLKKYVPIKSLLAASVVVGAVFFLGKEEDEDKQASIATCLADALGFRVAQIEVTFNDSAVTATFSENYPHFSRIIISRNPEHPLTLTSTGVFVLGPYNEQGGGYVPRFDNFWLEDGREPQATYAQAVKSCAEQQLGPLPPPSRPSENKHAVKRPSFHDRLILIFDPR
jgi:hypothetical protein